MARRYLVIAAIFGVFLLSAGSLLASPGRWSWTQWRWSQASPDWGGSPASDTSESNTESSETDSDGTGSAGTGGVPSGVTSGGGNSGSGASSGGTSSGGSSGGGSSGGAPGSGASESATAGAGFARGGSTTTSSTAGGSQPPPAPASTNLILKAHTGDDTIPPAEMANLYDYVVLRTGQGQRGVANQIKSANSKVKVLLYRTPHLIHTWEENWGTVNSHESWFMHDPSGRRTANDPTNFVMDIRNSEFRAYMIQYVMNLINANGFDGLFWDGPPGSIGLLTLNPGPDPAVRDTWHRDVLTYLQEFKQALGSKWVITNSTTSYDTGIPGADDTEYLRYVDGTVMEAFGHAQWNPPDAPPSNWGWQQRMAQRNVSAGKVFEIISGVDLRVSSSAQVHQWQLFSLGSALLQADGLRVYYEWHPWGTGESGIIFPEMNVPLGSPLGEAYSSGGVPQRDFSGGKVVVNPSGNPVTVNLPAGLQTLDGSVHTQTTPNVTIAPWSALILRK